MSSSNGVPSSGWVEVNRSGPCPACEKPDWCTVTKDGGACNCRRLAEHPRFGKGHERKDCNGATYWHYNLTTNTPADGHRPSPGARPAATDWLAKCEANAVNFRDGDRKRLGDSLGLPACSFEAFPLLGRQDLPGGEYRFTWPEVDGAEQVIGMGCRYSNGDKKSAPKSKRGLVVPVGWRDRQGPLLIPEGLTDTLALSVAGLSAVGRPSNTGGVEYLAALLRAVPAERPLIVLGENDSKPNGDWPGRAAVEVAARLTAILGRPVTYAFPPDGEKDVRAWLVAQNLGDDLANWHAAGQRLLGALETHPCKSADGMGTAYGALGGKPPRLLPPYRPFPLDALPDPLGEFVRQGAAALGCDPVYVALPALAAVAATIGNTRVIRLKRTWAEPCVLWAAVVGESGTLKSPAQELALGPLVRLERPLLEESIRKQADYAAARRDGDTSGKRPPRRRIICGDITIETLAELLADNPRGLVVVRDELSGWFNSFTRYRGSGSDLPQWLEVFRASRIVVDRKTTDRPTIHVPRAAVSVVGGIQPGVLVRSLTAEFLDSGTAARILMAMPPAVPKCWREDELDPRVEDDYARTLATLFGLSGASDGDGIAPHDLALSPEARAAWVGFYNQWARELASAEGEMASALAKLEGYAARFALLHHVVARAYRQENDLVPVRAESIRAGSALCRWFAHEARRIYATLTESAEERDARRLVEFLRARGGRITARALQRSNSRKYSTADAAETALNALAGSGLGTWTSQPSTHHGGRPTRLFELRPTHDTTDTTGDDEDGDATGAHDTTGGGGGDLSYLATFVDVESSSHERLYAPEGGEPVGGSVGCVMRRTLGPEPEVGGNPGTGEEVVSGGSVGQPSGNGQLVDDSELI